MSVSASTGSAGLKVVKRITEDVKEFDNKDDFIKYYELNKNELKDFSTCILNKKFKIKGYHLGRQQGELKLIPLDLYRPSAYRINQEDNQIILKLDVLNEKLDTLNRNINKLINQLVSAYASSQ